MFYVLSKMGQGCSLPKCEWEPGVFLLSVRPHFTACPQRGGLLLRPPVMFLSTSLPFFSPPEARGLQGSWQEVEGRFRKTRQGVM